MSKYLVNRNPLVANLNYRIKDYYPHAKIQIGTGNANGEILVIQPHSRMPERDAVTGALKNFGMLRDAYRATSMIVDSNKIIRTQQLRVEASITPDQINRYYLKELIEIIQPALIVACGPEVLSLLKQRKVRSFDSHTGKKFRIPDMKNCVFFSIIDPREYGFARAPLELKEQGKKEWTNIEITYRKLKQKLERERWAY